MLELHYLTKGIKKMIIKNKTAVLLIFSSLVTACSNQVQETATETIYMQCDVVQSSGISDVDDYFYSECDSIHIEDKNDCSGEKFLGVQYYEGSNYRGQANLSPNGPGLCTGAVHVNP